MKRQIVKSGHVAPGSNTGALEWIEASLLRPHPKDARRRSEADVKRAMQFVAHFPDRPMPIMVDGENRVLVGGVFWEAARRIGAQTVLVLRQHGLSEIETLLFSTGANKLLELGSWDAGAMDAALREFENSIPDFSAALIGFAPGELDRIVGMAAIGGEADTLPPVGPRAITKKGCCWLAGRHRIACDDATSAIAIATLLNGGNADAAIVDPPFGCEVNGFVSKKGLHREFVEGSGEKSREELLEFFRRLCAALHHGLRPGSLIYLFIDWRSLSLLQQAAEEVFGTLVQFCVWAKDRAGQGSFYRSQHELVLVFAKAGAPHRNNIQLGRHGRNRSNVWDYPSAASSRKGREKDMLKHHPTPKSVEMIADVLLDCTARGEIVLDTCLGSGTALIAAERTNRICYGMDLDPLYVDLAIRRWQEWTGQAAIDAETGRTFDEIAALALTQEAGDE